MPALMDMEIKLTKHQLCKPAEKNKKSWAVDHACLPLRQGLWTKPGFTLLEVLVVLVIMGFFIAMMVQVFTKGDDQRRFDETRIRMEEIKKAILGSKGAYANGQRQFAGYVADMGGLPALLDVMVTPADPRDDVPRGLWTDDLDDDGTADLPAWVYNPLPNPPDSMIWMGWRGPYIEKPTLRSGEVSGQEKLRDSWGNHFEFYDAPTAEFPSISVGDFLTVSRGADGISGGSEYNEDISLLIKHTEHEAPLAGRVKGFDVGTEANVMVTIYFPSSGIEPNPDHAITGVPLDGYFRFESGAVGVGTNGTRDISVGLRNILVSGIVSGVPVQKQVIFTVEPTGNWLGDIEIQ